MVENIYFSKYTKIRPDMTQNVSTNYEKLSGKCLTMSGMCLKTFGMSYFDAERGF